MVRRPPTDLLKAQLETPKNPNAIMLPRAQDLPSTLDLPRVTVENEYGESCNKLVYCIWKSGRHAVMQLMCNSWKCNKCGNNKLEELVRMFADATLGNPIVHEILIDKDNGAKVLKALNRKEISALSLKLTKDVYMLSSDGVEGRTWKTNPIERVDAIIRLKQINVRDISRRDFIKDWRPENLYEPKKDTVVYSTVFSNMDDLEYTIEKFGLDLRNDYIPGDPVELIERIIKLGDVDFINFSNLEYPT